MSKAQYDIYVNKNIQLVRSMVIKNELFAQAMNDGLRKQNIEVLEEQPETWRYYLNLAGVYHTADRPMTVLSLDTLTEISFTKENLRLHAGTRREYRKRGRFYDRLVERYPDQQLLIDGILNPVDIDTAINAKPNTVLSYDPTLVEENETNLILKVNEWLRKFEIRWNNRQYQITDPLYPVAQYGVMITLLPSVIMNIRLSNCFTDFAHSYHIRMHLASNGGLDVFIDYLTRKQMLWLYRNIRYLRRHAGKQETFFKLIEKILTDRGFPINRWRMRHNTSEMVNEIRPRIEYEREYLNRSTQYAVKDTNTTIEILNKENPHAKRNPVVLFDAETETEKLFKNAKQDRMSTKALESAVVDTTDSNLYPLPDMLLNYWAHWAMNGQYTSVITVEDPSTATQLQFNVKDAYIAWLYLYNRYTGTTVLKVPKIRTYEVRRANTPTASELIRYIGKKWENREKHVAFILDDLVPIHDTYVSTDSFYDTVYAVWLEHRKKRLYLSSIEHLHERGQVEVAMRRLYMNRPINLANEQLYTDWFRERGLKLDELSREDAGIIAAQLLEKTTGLDLRKAQTLSEVHSAMLRLMTVLSSYSIQFIQTINRIPIQVVHWPSVHIGDMESKQRHKERVNIIAATTVRYHNRFNHHVPLSMDDIHPISTRSNIHHMERIDLNVNVKTHDFMSSKHWADVGVSQRLNEITTSESLWNSLSSSQRLEMNLALYEYHTK